MSNRPLCSFNAGHLQVHRGKDLDWHGLVGDPYVAQLPRIREQWHRRLDMQMIAVPYWKAAAATGLLPLLNLWRIIRKRALDRRRRRIGLCPRCGYDLRATPDRCPECGKIPAEAKK